MEIRNHAVRASQSAPPVPAGPTLHRSNGHSAADQVRSGKWWNPFSWGGEEEAGASAPSAPSVPSAPSAPSTPPAPPTSPAPVTSAQEPAGQQPPVEMDPALRADLNSKIHRIETIGKAIGGDMKLKVEEGREWSHTFQPDGTQRITYRPEDLVDKSGDYAVGKVLNEAAKARYSRWVVEPELANNESYMVLENSVESARTGNLLSSRFLGAKDYLGDVYEHDLGHTREQYQTRLAEKLVEQSQGKLTIEQARAVAQQTEVPKHVQYADGVLHDWYKDGQLPENLDPQVRKVLETTREDFRQAYELKREIFKQDLSPLEVQEQAQAAHDIVRQRLWPQYQGLVQDDIDKLSQSLQGKQQQLTPEQMEQMKKMQEAMQQAMQQQANQNLDQAGQQLQKAGQHMQNTGQQNMKQAGQQMQQAGQQLQQADQQQGGKEQPANQQLQNAGQNMQQAADQLQQMADQMGQQNGASQLTPQQMEALRKAIQQAQQQQQNGGAKPQESPQQQNGQPQDQKLQQEQQKTGGQSSKMPNIPGMPTPPMGGGQGQKNGQPQSNQQPQAGQTGGQPQPGAPQGQPQPGQTGGGQPQPGQMGGTPQAGQSGGQPSPEQLQQMLDELKNNPAAQQQLAEALKNNPELMQQAQQALQNGGGQEAAQKLEQAAQAMQQAGQGGKDQGQSMQQAGQNMQEAGKQLEELGKKMQQEGNPDGKEVEEAGKQLQQAGESMEQAGQAQDQANGQGQEGQGQEGQGQPGQGQPGQGQPGQGQPGQGQPGQGQPGQGQPGQGQPGQGQPGQGQPGQPSPGQGDSGNGQVNQGQPSEAANSLPKMSEQEARELAKKVIEQMAKEMNDKLETEQKDARRGQQPQQGQQSGQSGDAQQSQGKDGQSGDDKDVKQGEPNEGDTDRSQGSNSGQTSNIDLPTLEELIRRKQEMEAKLEAMKTDYDRYHGPVAPMADELAGELKNFLNETQRPKYKRPLRDSGKKIDMRGAMGAQAKYERTGTYDPNVWLRRTNPSKRGHEFIFVLDESGSMGGDKWDYALKALIMGMEALDSLDIEFGMVGFSDYPKVHKELHEKFDLTCRGKVLSDIEGVSKGGTNDDKGIESALEMFKKGEPDVEKVMVVISDGIGNAARVKQIQEEVGDKVHIIGVGIGPGMEAIQDVYKHHAMVERLEMLPLELAEIIRERIEGEEQDFYV